MTAFLHCLYKCAVLEYGFFVLRVINSQHEKFYLPRCVQQRHTHLTHRSVFTELSVESQASKVSSGRQQTDQTAHTFFLSNVPKCEKLCAQDSDQTAHMLSSNMNELYTFGRFFTTFLQRRKFWWLIVCFPAHQSPSEKVSTLKGKHLLPKGSKFIPIWVDPFSEDRQHQFDRLKSLLPTETASILPRFLFWILQPF